jgi:hypothetical protein
MNNLIMKCLFGSHLYGLQTPSSDKDYKGIYLPERDNLLLGNYAKHYSQSTGDDKSKNTADDIDVEIFSLPYFIELACKGETVAIDMLHAKDNLAESVDDWHNTIDFIWDELLADRTKFYTKDMKSYVGYARKQANKYGIRGSRMGAVEDALRVVKELSPELRLKEVWDLLPTGEHILKVVTSDKSQSKPLNFYEVCGRKYQDTLFITQLEAHLEGIYNEYGERAKQAKDNLGCDFKAISHALRASYQMLGILKDGDFDYPLPQTKFLLEVKTGQLNFVNEVQPELESVILTIEKLAESSKLPQKVDRNYWDQWLLKKYHEYL